MAPLIVLIIFTSGYTFIRCNPLARFRQSRLGGHESYFSIGMCGVLITLLAWIVVLAAEHGMTAWGYYLIPRAETAGTHVKQFWREAYLTIGAWAVLSHVLAFSFGVIRAKLRGEAESAAILACDDSLSALLLDSSADWKPIQITLNSRKVYIGISLGQVVKDDFSRPDYVEIMPLQSGYRDKDSLEIRMTSDYAKFYRSWGSLADAEWPEHLASYRVVLPVSEIRGAAFFRPDAHEKITPAAASRAARMPFRKQHQK